MSKSYYEKLRDPRWQKKRLEIMERDGFTCRDCGSATNTLNVHHAYYEKGFDPWEYPDGSLKTLCELCHNHLTCAKKDVDCALVQLPARHFGSVALLIEALTHVPEEYRDYVAELDAESVATSLLALGMLDWRLRNYLTSPQHIARIAALRGYVKRDEVANG